MFYFFSSEQYTDLRYSTDLCDEENEFREKRKAIVFEAMNKMLGDQGPQTMDEVGYLVSVVIITWNLLTKAMRTL